MQDKQGPSDPGQTRNEEKKAAPPAAAPRPGAPPMVSMSKFFEHNRPTEKILLIVGTIAAVIAGALLPSMAIVLGEVINTFDPASGGRDILY